MIERIEKEFIFAVGKLYDEMTRHADTDDGELQAPSDLEIDSGERNGNPNTPIENIIKKAVPRIVIVFSVPPESKSLEQQSVDLFDSLKRRIAGMKSLARHCRHVVEF